MDLTNLQIEKPFLKDEWRQGCWGRLIISMTQSNLSDVMVGFHVYPAKSLIKSAKKKQ